MATTRVLGTAMLTVGLFAGAQTVAEEPSEGGVFASATEVRPLLVGTAIPEGTLRDQKGAETTVAALMGEGPAVFVFYRGHW